MSQLDIVSAIPLCKYFVFILTILLVNFHHLSFLSTFPLYSYPVHCAVLGGQLGLLKWLVETHCCPINHCNEYTKSDTKQSKIGKEAIVTSKGLSVLGLAMESHQLDIQRYLIVERKMNFFHYTNLRLALKNLAICLEKLPKGSS